MRAQTMRLIGYGVVLLLLSVATARAADDLRFIQAVRNGDTTAVRALLKQNVDVNATQPDGATALHWAAYNDDPDTVDLLLRAGAKADAANQLGATPLYLACENGNAVIVTQLLKAGANANSILPSGETALHTAARSGAVAAVKALLLAGANIHAKEHLEGQNALMWAVSQNHPEVVQALLEAGSDIRVRSRVRHEMDAKGAVAAIIQRIVSRGQEAVDSDDTADWIDEGGLTPLLFAARIGSVESARLLLPAGADVNEAKPDGATALVMAAHGAHDDLVKFLLDKGAEVDSAAAGYTALHAAVLRGRPQMVRDLIAKGANVNRKLEKGTTQRRQSKWYALPPALVGATPFFMAAKWDEPQIMRLLLAAGADPTVGLRGQTPLMAAAGMSAGTPGRLGIDRRGRAMDTADSDADIAALNKDLRMFGTGSGIEGVKIIVELGADVNTASPTGDTALHTAAAHGYDNVIKYLVEKGAKLDARNKRGQTPLEAALAMKDADDPTIGTTTVAVIRELMQEKGIVQQ